MSKLRCKTGLGTQCGVCRKQAKELLSEITAAGGGVLPSTSVAAARKD